MARDLELIKKRNEKIVKRFDALCSEKTKSGATKYSYDYLIEKLKVLP